MTQTKPHLLHVYFESIGQGGVKFRVACRLVDEGIKRPCRLIEECLCKDRPRQPDLRQPSFMFKGGERQYDETADPVAVKVWRDFWTAVGTWEESHPEGNWHPKDACWVEEWVRDAGWDDGWELSGRFDGTEIRSPLEVGWENEGAYEDSHLILRPWKDFASAQ